MAKVNKVPDFIGLGKKLIKDANRYASVQGLRFFQDSFRKQGWTDTNFTPWQGRTDDQRPGGAILAQTGALRDSIQILERSAQRIVFGSHSPYAEIHNEGGTISIKITAKSRKFFWFMYKATNNDHWKWMALSKKDRFAVKMPQRKFMGESQTLNNKLDQWLVKRILTQFKPHLKP